MPDYTHHTDRYRELADKWAKGTITEAELKELEAWYNTGLDEEIRTLLPGGFSASERQLRDDMFKTISEETGISVPGSRRILRRSLAFKWAAAAVIALLLGSGIYYFFYNERDNTGLAVNPNTFPDVKAPSMSRATITLAGGQKIFLDSTANGQLAVQNNVQVVKTTNGNISYRVDNTNGHSTEIVYNTLTNPRGSRVVDITLADGSRVWLNAASSITYPVAFAGRERNVSITGEAYFEIAQDANKPFTVSKGAMQVQVLGTSFNVNAYEDEANMKVTLLQGSVKVVAVGSQQSAVISPGEQVQVTNRGKIRLVDDADTEGAVAWKNGSFHFDRISLSEVLKEMSRWYDVEVDYQGKAPDIKIWGDMQRDLSLSEALTALGKMNVHFRIEGKKLIVMP